MNTSRRKIGTRVLGIHVAIIFLMLIIPAMRGCFKPKPKEIVTFIDFGEPAPTVNVEPVSKLPDPTPPEPKPANIAEPSKPKPSKPKIVPKREKPKPKPKWKPVDPKDIKRGRRVSDNTPVKPAISSRDIEKALSGIASSSRSTATPSRFNNYYARVMTLFYNHWTPPAAATSSTGSSVVRISMRRNGQITKRAKTKSSGDPLYDRTVMDAVNAVSTLPKPPSDYPYDYVEVVFTLDN